MKKFLGIVVLVLLSTSLFAQDKTTTGGFYFTGAYGISQVDGKSANSLLLDLDFGTGNVALGVHFHFPIVDTEKYDPYTSSYVDEETKVPLVTLNLKVFTGSNLDGLFVNLGFMAFDDGNDDESTEEDESKIIYAAVNFGVGFSMRLDPNFSLIIGAEVASAASQGQVTNMMSAYVGLMF